MSTWVMVAIAAVIVALPPVLGVVFHGRDRADSRGRRRDVRWRDHRV